VAPQRRVHESARPKEAPVLLELQPHAERHPRESPPAGLRLGLIDERARRTATVVATTPMRLVVMFGRDFRQMERDMAALAEKVRTVMEERLARA